MKSRGVAPFWQVDTHRIVRALAGVILLQFVPQFRRRSPNDGICLWIKIGSAIEDGNTHNVFFRFRCPTLQCLLDDESEKAAQSFGSAERWARQHTLEFCQNSFLSGTATVRHSV